jgi:signal-transduction protein with cAMP-binding, CBS, and nucleotidyltransferase domain
METLQITKEAAILAHEEASSKGKTLLENLFGKKTFLKNIKDRVKSIEDAIAELGEDDVEVIELRKLQDSGITSHILKQQIMVVITKALNEGWIPDWSNSNETKYFPWFRMGSSSGSGFSFHVCDSWGTYSHVGSRLCFKSRELAEYAGKQFTEIYKEFMTI